MSLYFVIKSVNEERREVGGLITCEKVDKDGQTLDYEGSKPEFQAWSLEAYNATTQAGQEPSFGNVREQHSKRMVGKFIEPLQFNDEKKTIWGLAKIYDDDVWGKTKDGAYNGFSVGGNLKGKPRKVGNTEFITIIPREVSIVDNPAVDDAHFDFIRAADGQVMKAAFKHRTPAEIYSDIVVQLEEMAPVLADAFPSFSTQVKVFKAADPSFKVPDPAYAPDAVPDQGKRTSQPPTTDDTDAMKRHDTDGSSAVGDPDTQLGLQSTEAHQPRSNEMIVKVSPPGWSDTVEDMKDLGDIDNPWALAWWMHGEGFTPHKMSKAAFGDFYALFKKGIEKMAEPTFNPGGESSVAQPSVKPLADPGAATASGDVVQKREVSDKERSELADKGHAMPDGSYPIANDSDLSNAVQAFGRNPTDAVKNHIKSRAKDLGREDLLPDKWEKAAENQLSHPSTDTGANMPTEVEKAARLSLHSHLSNLKGHLDKCKAAVDGLHAAGHDICEKCMKLAGGPSFDADSERTGGQPATGSAAETEVKAAKAEIEKLSAAVKTLTETVEKMTKPEVKVDAKTDKAAKADESVVGDKTKAQPTGDPVEKAAQAKKEEEATLELAKAAFGVDSKGQRCSADPKAMDALYSKVTKRIPNPNISRKATA